MRIGTCNLTATLCWVCTVFYRQIRAQSVHANSVSSSLLQRWHKTRVASAQIAATNCLNKRDIKLKGPGYQHTIKHKKSRKITKHHRYLL